MFKTPSHDCVLPGSNFSSQQKYTRTFPTGAERLRSRPRIRGCRHAVTPVRQPLMCTPHLPFLAAAAARARLLRAAPSQSGGWAFRAAQLAPPMVHRGILGRRAQTTQTLSEERIVILKARVFVVLPPRARRLCFLSANKGRELQGEFPHVSTSLAGTCV